MILFSNGCSFLTPRPKDGVDTFTTKIIAENYGMDLVNLAMGGRGNTRIGFSTKVWVEQNKGKDMTTALKSVGERWKYMTEPNRIKNFIEKVLTPSFEYLTRDTSVVG